MATKFQIKRSSVSGRTPNTTNAANSSYIAAGELALNLTDKKMYSSNGTNYFEIGSFKVEQTNSTSNVSTFTEISTLQFDEDSGFAVTSPSTGVAKIAINSTFKFWQVNGVQKLTAAGLDTVNFIGGNNISITANGANTPQSIAFATSMTPTFTSVTFGNSTVNTTVNSSSIAVTKIFANGVTGSAGQVLSANSTGGIYWETSAGGAGTLTVTSDTFNGNGSNTIFTLSTSSTTDRSFVYLNGVQQAPTTDYTISGTTLTFVAAPASNNVIEVRSFDIPSIADITITSDTFTANGTQTNFTLSTPDSSVTNSLVFLNGVTQVPTTDYTLSSTTLTFLSAPVNGTAVQAISFTSAGVKSAAFTGNGSNTQFTLPVISTTSKTIVAINGVTQTPVTDYSVSGTTLIFAVAPVNNDNILVRVLPSKVDSAGSNTNIQYNKSGSLGGSAGFTFNDTTNNVVVGNTLTVPNFILNASNPPANSTSTGTTGTFAWDSSFFYVATGTNTWKKVPITTDGAGGGNGTPGGSNTHIQYNDSNTFNGSAAFTFNESTNTVALSNTLAIGSNVTVNTSTIFIGNSSVNTTITAGNVHLQGTQLTVGNVVLTGEQLTVGNSTVNSVIRANGATFTGHLMPSANVTYDIGNSAMRWRDLWLSGTTINLGGATIKTDIDTGAIAFVPKATADVPNPKAVVVSPRGGIKAVDTTDGVPVINNSITAVDGISYGNSTVNTTINSTSVSTVVLNVGSNVFVNTSTIFIGNSSVNTTVNSSSITATKIIANGAFGSNGQVLVSNGTAMYWGASGSGGSGLVRDSFIANSTVNNNFTLSKEPANEAQTIVFVDSVLQRDADYSLSGTTLLFVTALDNGAELDVYISDPATTEVAGANTNIIFNDSDFANGTAAFTFNKATNTVSLSNTLVVGNSTVNTVIRSNGATFGGDLMPSANVTYDIGNSTMRWKDLWLSGSTINLGGASIKTDTDTGAIALIPKPTAANPDPVAMVVSPTGGITSVPTTGGVPAANAVAEAAESNTASPVPIDITSTAPANGQALIWSSSANTFVPGNVAAGGASSDIPKITGLIYPSDDTAANTSGGQTVYIRGSNFAANCTVYINGTAVPSVSFISSSNVGFTTPALSANVYPVYVINPGDGATAIHIPGLNISGVPSWSTAAGSLGDADGGAAWSFNVSATSDSSVTYALAGGSSLPSGISLASNGLISGTLSSPPASETTYNFSVVATDLENQDASRSFSVVVTVGDPYFYLTTLLLHGDGTNNKNNHTFLDSSNNNFTITRNGNATQGSFSPFSQTGWSGYFDGTGDYLTYNAGSTLSSIGSGPLTIEAWVYYTGNHSGFHDIFITNTGMGMLLDGGKLRFYGFSATTAATNLVQNTWVHVAVVRQSSNVFGFVNGIKVLDTTTNVAFSGSTGYIGSWSSGNENWPGYISNLRVSNSARYTANFTPSTTQFTSDANTALLTLQSNRFIDNSNNNFAITRNGDVSIQAFSPFAPTAAYSTANVGGSGYFDGSGDYLTIANNSSQTLASNYTLEFWVYRLDGSNQMWIGRGDGGGVWGSNSGQEYLVYIASGTFYYQFNGGGSAQTISTATLPPIGAWSHIAIARNGTTTRMWLNGASVGTSTASIGAVTGATVWIGTYNASAASYYFNGYLTGIRFVQNTAVYDPNSSTITVPTAPLTAITNTSLLLNFTNAGIFDQTAKNILETIGDAKVSTAQYKYGTGSMVFDGNGDYLTIRDNLMMQMGSGNFTIEFWWYPNSIAGYQTPYDKGYTGAGGLVLQTGNGDGRIIVYANGSAVVTSNTAVNVNNWTHMALVRNSTSLTLYQNGVSVGSATNSTNFSNTSITGIGGNASGLTGYPINGYIDDLRITKGYARYTSNFTPPTSAFKDR